MNCVSLTFNFNFAHWFNWLENTSVAIVIRQSSWAYPILEIVHIVGIVLLVGAAFMFDFRLIGFSKNISIAALAKHLIPWSQRGLILVIPSGILLFITNAESLGKDSTFWIKICLIVLAALNASYFHSFHLKEYQQSSGQERLLPSVKLVAIFSITLWLAIITFGRLLAY